MVQSLIGQFEKGLPAVPRLRASHAGRFAGVAAFALSPGANRGRARIVNQTLTLIDEPFRIGDIQLKDPQIAVLTLSFVEIFGKFRWIFRVLALR